MVKMAGAAGFYLRLASGNYIETLWHILRPIGLNRNIYSGTILIISCETKAMNRDVTPTSFNITALDKAGTSQYRFNNIK
jgi:hypothetical protein